MQKLYPCTDAILDSIDNDQDAARSFLDEGNTAMEKVAHLVIEQHDRLHAAASLGYELATDHERNVYEDGRYVALDDTKTFRLVRTEKRGWIWRYAGTRER